MYVQKNNPLKKKQKGGAKRSTDVKDTLKYLDKQGPGKRHRAITTIIITYI